MLAAAPLYAGVLTKASALLQSKHGPSILQPYRDLAKWLSKGSAISDQTSWIFQAAPYLAMAGYLVVSTIVPIITSNPLPLAFLGDLLGGAFVLALSSFVMSLAAYDTASPLGGLGASRTTWLGGLAEPAFRRFGEPAAALVAVTPAAPPNSLDAVRAKIQGRGLGDAEIVLCVPLDDPAWSRVDRVQDLPAQLREDIERFITARPAPEGAITIAAWCSRDDALTAIDDAAARWAATVNGRG